MRNKGKENKLVTIIKWYAIIIITIILLFVSLLSYYLIKKSYQREAEAINQAILHVGDVYAEDMQRSSWMADKLLGNQEKIESAQKYFDMPLDKYMNYILNRSAKTAYSTYYFLPQEVKNLYLNDRWVSSISFTFNNSPKIFYSNASNKGGLLTETYPEDPNHLTFTSLFFTSVDGEVLGTFRLSIMNEKYDEILENYQNEEPIQMLIISDSNQILYKKSALTNKEFSAKETQFISSSKNVYDYKIIGFVSKQTIIKNLWKELFFIWVLAIFTCSLLIYILYRLLFKYQQSVNDILISLNKVSKGDLSVRIDKNQKEAELWEISSGINYMMDNINSYVVDNYRLEAEQKDANMRALQAQINPHFLYNTLEYIRMYAVNVGAKELANVVYAFSSLLRNTISQEKYTTLEKELEFCRRYIYLYQMRYPECVAYTFEVEEQVKKKRIPKFLLQPLIENYFVHGLDFEREDNLIYVKAYVLDERLIIDIRDNGLGMDEQKMHQIETETTPRDDGSSIGIKNVRERLRLYFEGDFLFKFMNNYPTGTIIVMNLPLKKEEAE